MATPVYKALADPTRRKILQLLRDKDLSAGELAEHFSHAKPTLSRHFNVLKNADLIQGSKSGNQIIYRLNVSVLEEAMLAMMQAFKINLTDNNLDLVETKVENSEERELLDDEQEFTKQPGN